MHKFKEIFSPSKEKQEDQKQLITLRKSKLKPGEDYYPWFLQETSNKKAEIIHAVMFMDYIFAQLKNTPSRYQRNTYLNFLEESKGLLRHDTDKARKNTRRSHLRDMRRLYQQVLNSIPHEEKKNFAEAMVELEAQIATDESQNKKTWSEYRSNSKEFLDKAKDIKLTDLDKKNIDKSLSHHVKKLDELQKIEDAKNRLSEENTRIEHILADVFNFSWNLWRPILKKNPNSLFDTFNRDAKEQGYYPLTTTNLNKFLTHEHSFEGGMALQDPNLVGGNNQSLIPDSKAEEKTSNINTKGVMFDNKEIQKITDDFNKETKTKGADFYTHIDEKCQVLNRYKNQLNMLREELYTLEQNPNDKDLQGKLGSINKTLDMIHAETTSPLIETEESQKSPRK